MTDDTIRLRQPTADEIRAYVQPTGEAFAESPTMTASYICAALAYSCCAYIVFASVKVARVCRTVGSGSGCAGAGLQHARAIVSSIAIRCDCLIPSPL